MRFASDLVMLSWSVGPCQAAASAAFVTPAGKARCEGMQSEAVRSFLGPGAKRPGAARQQGTCTDTGPGLL